MIAGLDVTRNFLKPDVQYELIREIDAQPWSTALKRRVQHYGTAYDYRSRSIGTTAAGHQVEPLPDWGVRLIQKIQMAGITRASFDQIIINEYMPGQGIAPHIDSREFGDTIASVSLGSACAMTFTLVHGDQSKDIWLMPGDLMCMTSDARHLWRHGIRPRKHDIHQGRTVRRDRRISVTLRTV
jgi:alkylated DNA repair dioxygenase AlkB